MLRIRVTVADPSDKLASVKNGNQDEVIVGQSQTREFLVPDGGSLVVKGGDAVDPTILGDDGEPSTDISEGNHGNPNGISQAIIAPKGPGGSGMTEVYRTAEGEYLERTPEVEDQAQLTKGGGSASKESTVTPGPRPEEVRPAEAPKKK